MGKEIRISALVLAGLVGGVSTGTSAQVAEDYNLGVNDDFFLDQPPAPQATRQPSAAPQPQPVKAPAAGRSTAATAPAAGAAKAATSAAAAAGAVAGAAAAGIPRAASGGDRESKQTVQAPVVPTSTPVPAPTVQPVAPATPPPVAIVPPPGPEEDQGPPPPLNTERELVFGNSIAVTAQRLSDVERAYGQYTGLTDETESNTSISAHLAGRPAHESDETGYWALDVESQTPDVTLFEGVWGRQGKQEVKIGYLEITKLDPSNTVTPYLGAGSDTLTLPGTWVHNTTTSNMTELDANLREFDIRKERRRTTADYRHLFCCGWSADIGVEHEEKEGLRPMGTMHTFRGALVPQPVDYTTDLIRGGIGFQQPGAQYRVYYSLSTFKNDNADLTVDNPFTAGSTGQMSLPPDNTATRFGFQGGWQTARTSTSVEVSTGTNEQDEDILPYTTNAAALNAAAQPLPESLDGKVDHTQAVINFNVRPYRGATINARYRYDDRQDKREENLLAYVLNDAAFVGQQDCLTDPTQARCALSEAYSTTKQRMDLDYKQRIGYRNTVSVGLSQEKFKRDDYDRLEVEETTEDLIRLGWQSRIGAATSLNLKLETGDRSYDEYTPPADVPNQNLVEMRKFLFANRERQRMKLALRYAPPTNYSIGLSGDWLKDEYPDSVIGVQSDELTSITVDYNQVYSDALSWTLFVNRQESARDQDGRQQNIGGGDPCTETDTTCNWFFAGATSTDTLGLNVDWAVKPRRLNLRFDATISQSKQTAEMETGSSLTEDDFPENEIKWTTLGVAADYHVDRNMTVSGGVTRETFRSSDWAVDGVEPDSINNVLSIGQDSADYSVTLYSVSLRYHF